jgi:integrase
MSDYEIKLNNPFQKVKFTESDHIPNYLSRDQYHALLRSALLTQNYDLHDFIVLLTMTGCRPIELLTLTWPNVHLYKRQFIVRNYYSKSKRTMYKYLNQTAFDLLNNRSRRNDYVFTNPRTGNAYTTFSKSFIRCKKRAGVNCTMYDLRHTYASWLIQKGVGIYTIKDLLGHGDIDSTMRYAHLDYAQYVDAVDLII